MAATKTDYVAEAKDIHENLVKVDPDLARAYIQARCDTLSWMDKLFSIDRFTYTALFGHDRNEREDTP